jgi:hypothetical protein
LVPLQPPEAVQEVLFVLVQERVLDCPWVILEGDAVRETVGTGTTVTVTLCVALPPVPVHVSVYVVFVVGETD